jgi:hypothetical protein
MGGGTGTGTGTKVSGSTTPTFKSPPTSLNLNFDNPYTTKGAFGRSIFGRTSYDFTGNEFQDKGIGNWEDVG